MSFKNPFKRKETLGFKDVSKEIRREIKVLKAIKDEDERLERFQSLQEGVDLVMSNEDISRAVEKPDKNKDGFLYYLSPSVVLAGLFLVAVPVISGSSIPFLTPFLTPLLAISVGLAAATALVGHGLLYRSRAKELGLTPADVKYAHKLQVQQTKVLRETKALSVDDAMEENLKNLRDRFTASAVAAEDHTKARNLAAKFHAPAAMRRRNASPHA